MNRPLPGHQGIDVGAMRAGAQDFVVKPVGIERLQVSLRNALNTSALKGELQRIRHSREGRLTFSDIITRSEAMTGVLRIAQADGVQFTARHGFTEVSEDLRG